MSEYPKDLVAPDGRTAVAWSAREYNDLVYGGGYADKPQKTKADSKPTDLRPKAAKPEETT